MAETNTVYQAVVGLDFDSLKPPVRVESGGAVPKKASASDIKWLLEQGLIKEITINEESEGAA
jgi:hypothetical protein